MPFDMQAMASSRTPKWILQPSRCSGLKNGVPLSSVLFEGARSALPPNMLGIAAKSLFKTIPPQERVAFGASAANMASSLDRDSGISPFLQAASFAASSG